MSRIDKYADWLVDNQDKKGTPDFETVVNAYKELRAQESDTLVDDVFKLQEVPEDAPIETDFLDEIEEVKANVVSKGRFNNVKRSQRTLIGLRRRHKRHWWGCC